MTAPTLAAANDAEANVRQAVPFFGVRDLQRSLRFYVNGLGFTKTVEWSDAGRLQWCWLELGGAALMLQAYQTGVGNDEGTSGRGVSIYFICADALAIYRDLISRGVDAQRPFVGNRMWVTQVTDPDGYRLFFESPTDAAEESVYGGEA
jgi:catechol 2,3-dioxygenase-like lactoylglutathione lyase family enzyme